MSELSEFVLGYFRHAGALVEPSAYGVYDVLLPDDLARKLDAPAYERLAFEVPEGSEAFLPPDVTRVSYGHPLVERVANAAAIPAPAHLYVNAVRLAPGKHRLPDLARQALSFPNARLVEVPRQMEEHVLSHYARFHFKATQITDEKREQLVAVMMDVQAGHAVPELAQIERAAPLEETGAFNALPVAPLRWLPDASPLSRPALDGLLERAVRAAIVGLTGPLDSLQRRAARHLELDRARLEQYYDDLRRDLERRIARAPDEERRAGLDAKLAAVQAEREAKLADVEARYRLRVELELLNVLVIAQPKAILKVQIENRSASVPRTLVWDPLLRRVEPMVCDACGLPSERLFLCTGGHLAHEDCLAPQCVDCKRVYCRLCADQVTACCVCDRPVCLRSLNRCPTCERGTCREHISLCHAAEGAPAKLTPPPAPPPAREPPPQPVKPKSEEPAPSSAKGRKAKEEARKPKERLTSPLAKPAKVVKGDKLEVYIEPDVPVVTGMVLSPGRRELVARTWELRDDGIAVWCRCEKGMTCPVNGLLLRPAEAAGIQAQMEAQIEELRQEYRVPASRVFFHAIVNEAPRQVLRLMLRGAWKDEQVLASAQAGFQEVVMRQRLSWPRRR